MALRLRHPAHRFAQQPVSPHTLFLLAIVGLRASMSCNLRYCVAPLAHPWCPLHDVDITDCSLALFRVQVEALHIDVPSHAQGKQEAIAIILERT